MVLSSEGRYDDGGWCAITSRYVSVYLNVCVFVCVCGDAPVVLVITATGRHKCIQIFSLQTLMEAGGTHTHPHVRCVCVCVDMMEYSGTL